MSAIFERLKEERIRLGLNQTDFGAIGGVQKNSQVKYESGARHPDAPYLEAIAAAGADVNYILTGARAGAGAVNDKKGAYAHPPGGVGEDFVLVPQYDAEVSAGHGAFVEQEAEVCRMAFRRDWIREMGLSPASLALVRVKGDSMEPTLLASDLVLVDAGVTAIRDDGIYVLRRDGTLVIKRLQVSLGDGLYIRSDNPRYREESVPADKLGLLNIVGKVVWMGRAV